MGRKKDLETKLEKAIFKAIEEGKIVDYALNAGLAYFGFEIWGLPGLVMGPLALKLCMAPGGGVVSPSQAAGVAMLGYMGLTASGILDYMGKQFEISHEAMVRTVDWGSAVSARGREYLFHIMKTGLKKPEEEVTTVQRTRSQYKK